jgi:hypothetical protein
MSQDKSLLDFVSSFANLVYCDIDTTKLDITGALPTLESTTLLHRQPLPIGNNKHYVAVMAMHTVGGTSRFLLWGVCSIVKILIDIDTVDEVLPQMHPCARILVTYHRKDFVDPHSVSSLPEPLTCIRYPFFSETAIKPQQPLQPGPIALSEVAVILKKRIEQYMQPTQECICSTLEQLQQDRLSYTMMLSSMVQLNKTETEGLYPGTKPDWKATCDAWLYGEMQIAKFRLSWHHAAKSFPGLDGFEFKGRPFEECNAALLSHFGRSQHGRVSHGILYLTPVLWAPTILLEIERNHVKNINSYRPSFIVDHPVLAKLLREHGYRQIIWRIRCKTDEEQQQQQQQKGSIKGVKRKQSNDMVDWRRPASNSVRSRVLSSSPDMKEITDVEPFRDLGQLLACSSPCMLALAEEAFTHSTHHLKFEDRNIFYPYLLANGLEIDDVLPMLTQQVQRTCKDYPPAKIEKALKASQSFIKSGAYPISCKKLQTTLNKHGKAYCPFMPADVPMQDVEDPNSPLEQAKRSARRQCCQRMQATLHTSKVANAQQLSYMPSNFPLVYAQRLRRHLVVAYEQPVAAAPPASAAAGSDVPISMTFC